MSEAPRVLFVDDEENILKALRRLFRREPWEQRFAASGAEALALLEADGPADVVVTDQRMPGMSGVELLKEVRRRCPDSARIVLSGYTDVQAILDAVNEGAIFKFLTKPWDDAVLRQVVQEAVDLVQLRRENRALQGQLRAQEEELTAMGASLSEQAHLEVIARAVLDALPVGVAVVDAHGRPVLVNGEADRLLGPGAGRLEASPSALEGPAGEGGCRHRAVRIPLPGGDATAHVWWEV